MYIFEAESFSLKELAKNLQKKHKKLETFSEFP